MKKLKAHPIADAYPISDEDVDALADDIKEHGQNDVILLTHDGLILDGRNRYAACLKLGIEPLTEILPEMTDAQLMDLAWSKNGLRRHLSASQRACMAAIINADPDKPERRGRPRKDGNSRNSAGLSGETSAIIGKRFKVSGRMVEMATEIYEHEGSEKHFESIKEGKETLSAIYPAWKAARKAEQEALTAIAKPRMRELRGKAPDLADAVEEGRITYEEAMQEVADREEKQRKREEYLAKKYANITTMTTLSGMAMEAFNKGEIAEAIECRAVFQLEKDMTDLDATINLLTAVKGIVARTAAANSK
jgi:hypothetical protein